MNASDIMTRPATTVRQDAPLAEAIRVMLDNRISGLPVIDPQGRLVGMLTEGDLLRRAEVGTATRTWSGWRNFFRGPGLNADEYVHTHSRRVEDLMKTDPVTVTEATPLDEIVEIMEKRHFKRVPVVRGEEVVGIVSRADLLRRLGDSLGGAAAGGGDAAIFARLTEELERQPWFTSRNINITVKDGVVTLEGIVSDDRMRTALKVAARNISGNEQVNDDTVVVEPSPSAVFPAV